MKKEQGFPAEGPALSPASCFAMSITMNEITLTHSAVFVCFMISPYPHIICLVACCIICFKYVSFVLITVYFLYFVMPYKDYETVYVYFLTCLKVHL